MQGQDFSCGGVLLFVVGLVVLLLFLLQSVL